MVDPHDGAESLNSSCLIILYKVANEQTFALGLDEAIVTLSGASCSTAGCAESARPDSWDIITTWTLKLSQVDSSPVTLIELII